MLLAGAGPGWFRLGSAQPPAFFLSVWAGGEGAAMGVQDRPQCFFDIEINRDPGTGVYGERGGFRGLRGQGFGRVGLWEGVWRLLGAC